VNRPPLSPEAQRLLAAGFGRRRFLAGLGAGSLGVAAGGALTACGTGPVGTGAATDSAAEDRSDTDKSLVVSNWQLYIDIDEDDTNLRPTLAAFEENTGVSVEYLEDITDNESFYAKISPQLRAGQDIGRDLIVPTDWLVARLIRQGYLQPIDKGNTPNFPANLIESLQSPSFDPEREYSAPWQSGLTGIAYNSAQVPEVRTITELLTREDLRGKVTALLEMRDTLGLIMLEQGVDPAGDFSDDDVEAAIALLQQAVDSGQIRQFTGNEYSEGLARGDIAACIAWSGDVIQLQFDSPDLRFVAPEAGLMLWSDNMVIPNQAQHKKNAELWIDHYYDPAVAAELAAWVNFICPVAGAQEAMQDIDPELAENELIFPTDTTLAQTSVFRGLSEEEEIRYAEMFNQVTGA
jgi:spermidine/putrescine transport system substrate-binding protein